MFDIIRQHLRTINNKLQNLVTIGTLNILKESEAQVSSLNGSIRDAVTHFQSFGFRSKPPAGSKGVKLNVLANGSNSIIICLDNIKYHFTALKDGEAIMEVLQGCKIHLKADKTIDITSPTVNITGNLMVNGNITDSSGTSLADLRNTYNSHTNPNGGVVAQKVGVE